MEFLRWWQQRWQYSKACSGYLHTLTQISSWITGNGWQEKDKLGSIVWGLHNQLAESDTWITKKIMRPSQQSLKMHKCASGHTFRMPEVRLHRKLVFGQVKGRCPPGCPRCSFNDVAMRDRQLSRINKPYKDAEQVAQCIFFHGSRQLTKPA